MFAVGGGLALGFPPGLPHWLPWRKIPLRVTPPADQGNGKANSKSSKVATVRMLNKLTLEIIDEKIPIGAERKFSKLRVKAFSCYRNANKDAEAFLQIWDSGKQRKTRDAANDNVGVKNANGETQFFSGWMFSSSPALNPLNHPIYDVWLLGCE